MFSNEKFRFFLFTKQEKDNKQQKDCLTNLLTNLSYWTVQNNNK